MGEFFISHENISAKGKYFSVCNFVSKALGVEKKIPLPENSIFRISKRKRRW
jgi:hypothetical protein